LHPGEEVRTPLILLQFWEGDWIRAQNVWRRWMLVHNDKTPRPGGRLSELIFFGSATDAYGFVHTDEPYIRPIQVVSLKKTWRECRLILMQMGLLAA
jgi:hypothetical protein